MTMFEREIEVNGFGIVDRYLDPDLIETLIQAITALNLTADRAGIRNLLELVPSVRTLTKSGSLLSSGANFRR